MQALTFEDIEQAMKKAGLLEPQYDILVHPHDAQRMRTLLDRIAADYPIIEKEYMVRDWAIFMPRERPGFRQSPFDGAARMRLLKISEAEATLDAPLFAEVTAGDAGRNE